MKENSSQKRFEEVIQEIQKKKNDRKEPALESTERSLKKLGNAEEDYQIALIGGTNGKGSTVEMCSELLQSLGMKVGTYKSPHLVTARERIKINSDKISPTDFLEIHEKIQSLEEDLTFFEYMTVASYLYFSEKDVDYAIMEVGMGGRLDATNAADNELAAITNIGLDHTAYLGTTKREIAREKAGIIPENGKLITDENLEIFEKKAEERNTDITKTLEVTRDGKTYSFKNQQFRLPVRGSFQKENLETALTITRELEQIPEDLEKALSSLQCSGRMEVINEEPLYIQDGAHNVEAIETIIDDLPDGFICVFNATQKKDIEGMTKVLEQKAEKFILPEGPVEWSEEPEKVAELIDKTHIIERNPLSAVEKGLEEAGKNGAVVVTGSLYLIGAIKEER